MYHYKRVEHRFLSDENLKEEI